MKKVITLCVMGLLYSYTTFSQDCNIELGNDHRTCEFRDTLIGSPNGGDWIYLCLDTLSPINISELNDSSIVITFSKCGSYTFEYSINDSLCMISDTIQIDFENPSSAIYDVHVAIELDYLDFECQQDTFVSCEPFTMVDEAPKPIWTFSPKSGDCIGTSYFTTIEDSLFNCLVDSISLSSTTNSGNFTGGTATEFCQDEILQQEDGEITSDIFYQTIFTNRDLGLDSLFDYCPYPQRCHRPFPPECIDSIIYDTLQLLIPIHLGGNWQILMNNQLLPLDSNNIFTIDTIDYFLDISPNPQTYAATFDVKEITPSGDTTFLSTVIDFDFQWVENWGSDTVQHIDSVLIISDSCCTGPAQILYTHDPIPPQPDYDCPPFNVEFIPRLLATTPNVICNDSNYVVVIELSRGIPPYGLIGNSGTINGNIFTSDTISTDSLFFEFIFTDNGGCEEKVSGEVCPCLWGGNSPVYDLTTTDDCATNSIGALAIVNQLNGHPPYLYSIDDSDFQEDSIFENISTGLHELTLKDSFNCLITDEFFIENNDYEELENIESSYTICGNENILLEVSPSNPDSIIQILWDNGDTLFTQNVNQSGTYVADIANNNDCTIYSEIFNIENIPLPSINDIKIPNVFTPNDDGVNDDYHPLINEEFTVLNYSLSIFNRWGKRVFHSSDKNEKWQPNKEPMDVYVFMLELDLITCTGELINFKDSGDLTLIR